MNTNKNPKITRTMRKPMLALLLLSILLLTLFGGWAFLYYTDSFHYESQEKTHTRGFPVAFASDAQQNTTLQRINAWADVRGNMKGFVDMAKTNCVASLYRDLMQTLPERLDQSIPPKVTWQVFSKGYSGAVEGKDPSELMNYNDRTFGYTKPQGILPALLKVEEGVPTIIFTDLEDVFDSKYYDELSQQMKVLFDQGYSVRIDRLISAFSGKISNYANASKSFLYGTAIGATEKVPHIRTDTNVYHHQPRPFYMITVGTAAQCKLIGETIVQYAKGFITDENTPDRSNHINKDEKLYQMNEVFSYEVVLPQSIATLTEEEKTNIVSQTLTSDIVIDPAGAQDVQGYTMTRAWDKNGTAKIRFTVTPDISKLGPNYSMLWETPVITEILHLIETRTKVYRPEASEKYLTARGSRYLALQFVPVGSDFEAFVIQVEGEISQQSTLLFTINRQKIIEGLYRVTIPIFAKPNAQVNMPATKQLAEKHNRKLSEGKKFADEFTTKKNYSNTIMLKTLDLVTFEGAIRSAFVEAEENRVIQIGQITFDLRVE